MACVFLFFALLMTLSTFDTYILGLMGDPKFVEHRKWQVWELPVACALWTAFYHAQSVAS